jgi:hypothetical protein
MLASNKRYKRTNINLGNDWGFYVDMDDIPAPIYITSNILYSDRSALINYINDSNENIVNINNLDRILYNNNNNNNININDNINIVKTPLTKIVTIVSTIWSSLSSLLSNIEIMDYTSESDSDSDYDSEYEIDD